MKIPNIKIHWFGIGLNNSYSDVYMEIGGKSFSIFINKEGPEIQVNDENREVLEEYKEYLSFYSDNLYQASRMSSEKKLLDSEESTDDYSRNKVLVHHCQCYGDAENFFAELLVDGIPVKIVKIANVIKAYPDIKPKYIYKNLKLIVDTIIENCFS